MYYKNVTKRRVKASVAQRPSRAPSPMVASVILASSFEEIGVGVSIFAGGVWRSIHLVRGVVDIEVEHAADLQRWAYNQRFIDAARSRHRIVRGEHAGFVDL